MFKKESVCGGKGKGRSPGSVCIKHLSSTFSSPFHPPHKPTTVLDWSQGCQNYISKQKGPRRNWRGCLMALLCGSEIKACKEHLSPLEPRWVFVLIVQNVTPFLDWVTVMHSWYVLGSWAFFWRMHVFMCMWVSVKSRGKNQIGEVLAHRWGS